MPVFDNVFYEITALPLVAAVVGALALRLRQPLIVAFIAVGPARLGWVKSHDQVDLLAAEALAAAIAAPTNRKD